MCTYMCRIFLVQEELIKYASWSLSSSIGKVGAQGRELIWFVIQDGRLNICSSLLSPSISIVMKTVIKVNKKKNQKQLKRGTHYERMKELSTFRGMDNGFEVLMDGSDWEGLTLRSFQGVSSGGEPKARLPQPQRQQVSNL